MSAPADRPDRDAWLALALAPRPVVAVWGPLQRAETDWAAARARLADRPDALADGARIERALTDLARVGARVLTPAEADWPDRLRALPDPPAALFLRGDPAWLGAPQIAVVGARRASRAGVDDARWIAAALARAGLVVTSGLALGVDGAAHAAALDAGGGTVAVLGHGPDRVYPAAHRDLAGRVAAGGLLATEFAPGVPPLAHHFPRRNRLIAGLALGVVVVEAGERSGSMITARLAAAQGREVFVLPRRARDPGGAGGHRLLREGAVLVRDVDDIVEELAGAWERGPPADGASADGASPPSAACSIDDPEGAAVLAALDALDGPGVLVEEVLARTALTVSRVGAWLTELELDGLAVRDGERWRRTDAGAAAGAVVGRRGPPL